MKTAKDQVRELRENVPDDASLEDIQYHLYVRQKIEKGLNAAEGGRTLSHEEVVRRIESLDNKPLQPTGLSSCVHEVRCSEARRTGTDRHPQRGAAFGKDEHR